MKSKLLFAALTGFVMASSAGAADKAKAPETSASTDECHGINTCKAKGECGGSGHSCHGQNSCKGKGWVTRTEKDCISQGGHWKTAAAAAPAVKEAPKPTNEEPAKKELPKGEMPSTKK
jgi:hypothetical protein